MIEGLDVSEFQNAIDWPAVRAADFRFAYVRASDGAWHDKRFAANVAGAKAAGVLVGGYTYVRPSNAPGSGRAAAAAFVALLEGLGTGPGELPPALDLESDGGLSKDALSAWLRTYAEAVSEAVRPPVLYTFPAFWRGVATPTLAWAGDYTLWLAHYLRGSPYVPAEGDGPMLLWPWGDRWTFWQYSGDKSVPVPGVPTLCDRDRFHGTIEDLEALANVPPPCPEAA